jgi:hypothetical protein
MIPSKLIMPHGGYGLGNDLIPWAKGYILSKELGAKLLHPAWGNNPRGYWRYFGTSRLDWQWYRVLVRLLPQYKFDEHTYREIGENDFEKACRLFAEKYHLYDKQAYIITITGHWGAFSGIETAKHFIREVLYSARHTRENLHWIERHKDRDKLSVAVHIRRGDFSLPSSTDDYKGVLNKGLPLSWFTNICNALVAAFGRDNLQFLVASDSSPEDLGALLDTYPSLFLSDLQHSDVSDLIAMSEADLLICSLSTYSMWAAFLSGEPYLWFEPQLDRTQRGLSHGWIRGLGIFRECSSAGGAISATPRGIPVALEGDLPDSLLTYLSNKLAIRRSETDIVRGGSIPSDSTVQMPGERLK